tara:strand:- start:105 stop:809 length:705 start_codon:yes stop_codon:yes gene_type:complete
MKKFIYTFFVALFVSAQSLNAAGYIASYSVKVSNPGAYVDAMDNLMSTEWGKSFPAVVALHQYAFNGYDEATHVVVLNYEDTESLGKGTESFSDPVFQSFLAKTSSLAEPIEQSLNMKLINGGNYEPENNQVYTIYRMEVNDAASYAKAYAKVTKAQEEAGNVGGSYGLRALMGGSVGYYTHYAYTSAGSFEDAMKSAEVLYSSDSFAEFSKEVEGNRKIKNISIISTIKTYNN